MRLIGIVWGALLAVVVLFCCETIWLRCWQLSGHDLLEANGVYALCVFGPPASVAATWWLERRRWT